MRDVKIDSTKFVTTDNYGAEAMADLAEAEHAHWSALVVTALHAASIGATACQVLSDRLVEAGVSYDEIEELIEACEEHPAASHIKTRIGSTCIDGAVAQWNCTVAGLHDPMAEPEPKTTIMRGPGFVMISTDECQHVCDSPGDDND